VTTPANAGEVIDDLQGQFPNQERGAVQGPDIFSEDQTSSCKRVEDLLATPIDSGTALGRHTGTHPNDGYTNPMQAAAWN